MIVVVISLQSEVSLCCDYLSDQPEHEILDHHVTDTLQAWTETGPLEISVIPVHM